MHWIYFIPNQSFMNILHGYRLVHVFTLLYENQWTSGRGYIPGLGVFKIICTTVHYVINSKRTNYFSSLVIF